MTYNDVCRTIKGPFVGPCVVRVEPREPYATESDYRKNANLRNADQDRDFCANDQREAFGHKRQHKFRYDKKNEFILWSIYESFIELFEIIEI